MKRFAAVPVLFALGVSSAMAEVPAAVTTALADAKTDAVSVAGLVIVIVVAIAAFSFIRRAIK